MAYKYPESLAKLATKDKGQRQKKCKKKNNAIQNKKGRQNDLKNTQTK